MPLPRRNDPALFWAFTFMLFVLVLMVWFFCRETLAAELEEQPTATPAELEQGITYLLDRDHAAPTDPRRAIAQELSESILAAAQATSTDPWLITSMAFHESSFQLSACGKKGERGLLQVHGAALENCKRLGLDPTAHTDQSALCGASWLVQAHVQCSMLVRNWDKCRDYLKKGQDRAHAGACDGALSAYLSGNCTASDGVATKVSVRLRTRDKTLLQVKMPLQ
jgi:hypothetical protein